MGERTDMMSGGEITSSQYDNRDPEEIRADIERTRASISETVNTIQARLAPQRLKQEAQDKIREATIGRLETMAHEVGHKASEVRYTMMDTIKQNPIPAAMVGLGLGWLIMEGWKSSRDRYYYPETRYYPVEDIHADDMRYRAGDQYRSRSRVRETFEGAQHKAGEMASQAQDKVEAMGSQVAETASNIGQQVSETASQVTSQVAETASQVTSQVRDQAYHLGEQAQYQAQRAKGQLQYMMENNPMMVGAVALAAGMAIGFTLPETETEDRLLGEARDNLLDKAQHVTETTIDKAQRVAEEAGRTVMEEVQRQNLTSGQM